MNWYLLLLPAYVLVDAYAQAHITMLFRLYVPPAHQELINQVLHRAIPLLYVLLTVAVCRGWWPGYVVALLVRVALFDPVLNLVKGDFLFYVGSSAWLDKTLRQLTPESGGELASVLLRVLALAGAITLFFLL